MTSCSGDVPGGEADTTAVDVVVPAASGATGSFDLELTGHDYGRHSTGDLYDLVWGGGGDAIAALSPPIPMPPPPRTPEVLLHVPPSEHEMAAWLHTIVTGGQDQYAGGDDGDGTAAVLVAGDPAVVPAAKPNRQSSATERLPDFNCCTGQDSTRKTARVATRRANYAESHNQTEKRRRSKINQRLKTLQQLVPGCGETNQVSTLEQTIRYVKSLQQQLVQAMAAPPPPSVGGYYQMMRPVVCTGVAVPPMPVAAGVAGPGRGGCVLPGQGLFMGPVRWPSVWASMSSPPSACTDDGLYGPAHFRSSLPCKESTN